MNKDMQSTPGHAGSAHGVPVYQALAGDIAKLGVPVFGLMSDDTALLVATLDAMGVPFHGARHENNAIAMAVGYAAASGELGVAIIGRGPATCNAAHGSAYASRSGSGVLLIYGEASNAAPAPNGFGPDIKALKSVLGPDYLKNSSDFASVGMGFGTALGFARARPGSTTVLFIGDGGLLMTLGELETVVREDIPLVIALMNDCAYGAELHYLKLRDMPVARSLFPDVDYAPIAQAFGFRTATIRSLDDLQRVAPMLKNPEGPILLDCKINAAIAGPFIGEAAELEKRKS